MLGMQTASFDGYLDWARDALGIEINPSFEIRTGVDGENGMVITEDIEPGKVCCLVPFNAMLHIGSPIEAFTVEEQRVAAELADVTKNMTREDDILALRLLFERDVRGKNSRWARHLRQLPAVPRHSLLRWQAEELKELAGTNIHTLAIRWREQVVKDHAEIAKIVLGGAAWPSYDSYEWALSMVWSRCATICRAQTTFKVLVPVFDMCVFCSVICVGTTRCLQLITRRRQPSFIRQPLSLLLLCVDQNVARLCPWCFFFRFNHSPTAREVGWLVSVIEYRNITHSSPIHVLRRAMQFPGAHVR